MATPLSPRQGGNSGGGGGWGADWAKTQAAVAALARLRLVALRQHRVGCVAALAVGMAALVQASPPGQVLLAIPPLRTKPTQLHPIPQQGLQACIKTQSSSYSEE